MDALENKKKESFQTRTERPLEDEHLKEALKKQLEYYFSKENLMTDKYLISQMNSEMYVPIRVIANFKMVRGLTTDEQIVTNSLKELTTVTIDETGKMVKPNLKANKNSIILREISNTIAPEEIRAIFDNENCGKVLDVKSDINDFWYITFEDDDDAIKTLEYLNGKEFKGQPIKARLKKENTFRTLFASAFSSEQSVENAYGYEFRPDMGQLQNWGMLASGYAAYNGYSRENDSSYSKGNNDNRRTGYRKQQNKNYRGRGGFKGNVNKELNSTNSGGRKRRESGGSSHVLQFNNNSQFPPLPSQDKKKSGYEEEFISYSKQEIVDIISKMQVSKPVIEGASKVILETPCIDIEVMKPWPSKLEDAKLNSLAKSQEVTKKSSNSQEPSDPVNSTNSQNSTSNQEDLESS